MNEKKKKRLLIALIAVFCAIIVGAGGYILFRNFDMFNANNVNRHLQESYAPDLAIGTSSPEGYYLTMPVIEDTTPVSTAGGTTPATTAPAATSSVVVQTYNEPVNNPVDFEGLMQYNSDVYSWIYIPDTNISLPVAQSAMDDNFYLDHDVYKDYSFPGTIYSQAMNKKDYSDRVTVLYGHNMANGSMFADLHMFYDDDFFNSHPYIYIYTNDRRLTYEVISAHEYDSTHILNSYNFNDDSVFADWLSFAQNPRSVFSNTRNVGTLDMNSKILVLSTCLNSGDGRFLVQGVLIRDEKTQ